MAMACEIRTDSAGPFHEMSNSSTNFKSTLPTLNSSDYYTVPSLHELSKSEKSNPGFLSQVPDFKIGRFNYGHLKFPKFTDVRSLNLDQIVKFDSNSVTVYPNEADKPPLGQGLNKLAEVTLILQIPNFQGSNCKNITNVLKSRNEKQGAHFISFDPSNFEWKFNVDHFSRFGLDDLSDEEEESEEDLEMEGFKTRPVSDPLVSNGSELSRSLPANLRLDPTKMQEIRFLMINNLDEESEEEEIRAPFTQLPSNRKYNRNPNPNPSKDSPVSNSKGKSIAFGSPFSNTKSNQKSTQKSNDIYYSPSTSKSPQPLLEYNPNGSDLDPLQDPSPSSKILLTGQNRGPAVQLSKVVGFKLNEENSHKTLISNKNLSNCVTDSGLFMGRTFRAGWGPNGILIHSGNPNSSLNPKNQGLSSVIHIERVELDKIARDKTGKVNPNLVEQCFESPLEFHKSIQHESQEIETSDKKILTIYKLVTDVTMLDFISTTYISILEKQNNISNNLQNYSQTSLMHNISVWQLIKALFFVGEKTESRTEIDAMDSDSDEPDELAVPLARRAGFSYWIQESVVDRVHEQISLLSDENYLEQILLLLTGRQLDQAAELAVSKGDVRLAILISQAGGSVLTRSDLAEQLEIWRENGLDFDFIESDRVKIYELLSGNVFNAVNDLFIDWKRYLGLVMWYQLGPETPVQDIVKTYQRLLAESKVPEPVPVYLDEPETSTGLSSVPVLEDRFDILYYLMLLHANQNSDENLTGLIKLMFSALSSSNDSMDHHMIWHFRSILEAIGVLKGDFVDLGVLDMSFVYQLLGLGLVHWGIYVILHMECDEFVREKVIKEVLERYVEVWSKDEKQERFIEEIGVPKEWMHESLAIYYEYYGEKSKALEHYIGCASWQRAHTLFMTSAAHSLFLSSKHSEIWRITSAMEEFKSEIPNWDLGAGIYIDFYDLRTFLQEDNMMTDSDPLEKRREACKRFFDRLNESLSIWGNKLPLDARVVYAKMSSELNALLTATPGEGSASDVPMKCFGTMLSAPLPQDDRSYQLQQALSVFTFLISNES
ncbi:hypothetical protein LUZ60_005763 [Juncus effusus]|nr:hypothetical protein LUZ60_005763 [Juncus effusus]